MTNMPTSKTTETTEDPDKIGVFCRVHLKAEALLSTIVAFFIALPLLLSVGLYRLTVFVVTHAVDWLVWLAGQIVPFIRFLYRVAKAIALGLVTIVGFIVGGIACLAKTVYSGLLRLYRWINWCAVRSILRMVSMVAGIGSAIYIAYGSWSIYKTAAIITGKFDDPNATVYLIHVAIVVLLFAISIYYNAWAYSSDEERAFVCKRTVGFEKIHGWLK